MKERRGENERLITCNRFLNNNQFTGKVPAFKSKALNYLSVIIFLWFIPEKEEKNNKEGLGGETGMWRKIILRHLKMRKPEILLHALVVSEIGTKNKFEAKFINF